MSKEGVRYDGAQESGFLRERESVSSGATEAYGGAHSHGNRAERVLQTEFRRIETDMGSELRTREAATELLVSWRNAQVPAEADRGRFSVVHE